MPGRPVTGTWYLDAPDDRDRTRASDAKRRHNEHFARRSTPARSASNGLNMKEPPKRVYGGRPQAAPICLLLGAPTQRLRDERLVNSATPRELNRAALLV